MILYADPSFSELKFSFGYLVIDERSLGNHSLFKLGHGLSCPDCYLMEQKSIINFFRGLELPPDLLP